MFVIFSNHDCKIVIGPQKAVIILPQAHSTRKMVRTFWSKNTLFATITAAGDLHLPTSFELLANERDDNLNGWSNSNSQSHQSNGLIQQ